MYSLSAGSVKENNSDWRNAFSFATEAESERTRRVTHCPADEQQLIWPQQTNGLQRFYNPYMSSSATKYYELKEHMHC